MLCLMGRKARTLAPATPLRRMAAERGLRMDHVARLAGVKPWTLSRIASGEQSAPPLFFERLAAYMHCTADDIRPVRPAVAA